MLLHGVTEFHVRVKICRHCYLVDFVGVRFCWEHIEISIGIPIYKYVNEWFRVAYAIFQSYTNIYSGYTFTFCGISNIEA